MMARAWITTLTAILVCALLSVSVALATETVQSFAEIHANRWPLQLDQLRLPLEKNLIVVMFARPNVALDFSSTVNLKQSVMQHNLSDIDLGHTMLAWQCQRSWGVERGATAMSGERSSQTIKMINSGWGLTPFFSIFTDGFLESAERLETITLKKFIEQGRLQVVAIEVSQQSCDQLISFVARFVDQNPVTKTHFGLVPDPSQFQGAGCGSFVVSALEASGIWPDVWHLVWRTLQFPKTLLGCLFTPPEYVIPYCTAQKQGEHEVTYMDLKNADWDNSGSDGVSLHFVDPNLLEFLIARLQGAQVSPQDPQMARLAAAIDRQQNASVQLAGGAHAFLVTSAVRSAALQ